LTVANGGTRAALPPWTTARVGLFRVQRVVISRGAFEPQAGLVRIAQVARREHPGVGDHDRGLDAVPAPSTRITDSNVGVSALLHSKQPISRGDPLRSTNWPTTICVSTRRFLQ
jgi:hypothetical protein